MGIRENVQKMIDKKQGEIDALELQVKEARAYIQGLQDSMKLLPRDAASGVEHTLRPGSGLAKAQEAIRAAGTPLTITDILKAIGKPQDKKNRISMNGTLSGYARDGKVFTKIGNTFGLLEFNTGKAAEPGDDAEDLPEEFGSMQ
jgi:hypothetical protein